MIYTSDNLITAMKRNTALPESQSKFDNADFLAFLNEELQISIVGELSALQEDYFMTHIDTALVADQYIYDMPPKAIGWVLYDIGYLDSSDVYTSLPRINLGQLDYFNTIITGSTPRGFYVEDDKIKLVPKTVNSASGYLRFYYERIQNKLVLLENSGKISNVSTSGNNYICTVNNIPVTANGVDVISGTQSFGLIVDNATVVAVAANNITIAQSDFERAPVVGDYVMAKGETPVPHIPETYHPILAQAGVLRMLEASGDKNNIQIAATTYARMVDKLKRRSSSRVKAAPKKIIARSSVLNMMRRR